MSKREKIIAVVMAVVVLSFVMGQMGKSAKKKKALTKKQEVANVQTPAPVAVSPQPVKAAEEITLDLKRMAARINFKSKELGMSLVRDPFLKLEPKALEADFTDLVLSGLSWESEVPVVLINNQLLKQGDEISGFEIKEIRQGEVILHKGLERYTLKFIDEGIEGE